MTAHSFRPAMSASAAVADRVPPHVFCAVFHYLGPSFAVLLFAHLAPPGVAWLRITSAALIFALWRRPWRVFKGLPRRDNMVVVSLGVVLAAMNLLFRSCCFSSAD